MEKGEKAVEPQVKATEVTGAKDTMKQCTSKNKLKTYDEYTSVGFNQKYSEQGTFHIFTWTRPFKSGDEVFVQPGKKYGVTMAIAEGTKTYGDKKIPESVKTFEIPALDEIYYTVDT